MNQAYLEEEILTNESKRRSSLMGTQAILFVHLSQLESVDEVTNRMVLLSNQLPKNPNVPFCLLTDKPQEFDDVKDEIEVLAIPDNLYDVKSVSQLARAIQILAEKSPDLPKKGLQVRTLREFVEEIVCSRLVPEFYDKFKVHKKVFNSTLSPDTYLKHPPPQVLINFFNSAVDHLKKVIRNSDLLEISWPIPEFSILKQGK